MSKSPLWIALALCACAGSPSRSGSARDASAADAHERTPLSPAEIAAKATPAVVSIRTPDALGSGFVVRKDGWIVTNLHVVAGNDEVAVTLSDQSTFPVVEVLNASAPHDLVLLKIDAKDLPVLSIGESGAMRPGDPVVAIGHPLGLEDTVSNGLVSAVRKVDDLVFLQISAPIAPGSSGGPIFNDRGQVIGVAMAILRGGQNLNLGLPSEYVRELVAHPDPVPLATFASVTAALSHASEPEHPKPHHPITLFTGCDARALALLADSIPDAVAVGAHLYNQGNPEACYHVYEGAAVDIERHLAKRCAGPKRVLADARAHAAKLDDARARAWALRDAFDGLFDALKRKLSPE